MKIIDEFGNIVENPDLELGKVISEASEVIFRYDVTQKEQGHYEAVKEYPNGGKEVEWIVDVPEVGRWVAYDENGNVVTDVEITIPEDMPHELDVPMMDEFYRYVLYTAEELAEIAEQKKLQEEIDAKKAEQEEFLESAPTRMTTVETCISALTSAFGEVN